MQKEKLKTQKGITLIALIITIIVMLILVGVTVTVSLNGGLFSTAKHAATETKYEIQEEQKLDNGEVNVGGLVYESTDDYLNNNVKLAEGWSVATDQQRATAWPTETVKNEKVTAITDGTNTIPLPQGYQVSLEEGESTISTGLVITDGENEFVWIPVSSNETFENPYNYSSSYSEPTTLSHDTDANLKKYFGENHYTIANNFNYIGHYTEMKTSVEKYNGFYIGRYETTIDGTNIGSKENATVLLTNMSIAQTNNEQARWWGLYDVQRKANVKGNGEYVQTNMIWGQQWDAMLEFLGTEKANSTISGNQTGVLKSGEATYNNLKDEMNNIYDLRRNVSEWTAEGHDSNCRVLRAGFYSNSLSAFTRYAYNLWPYYSTPTLGSRLTLYIK